MHTGVLINVIDLKTTGSFSCRTFQHHFETDPLGGKKSIEQYQVIAGKAS